MEAKSETNKPISNFLFILWAGGTALLSYSLVYALRKPFTAATFDGMDFFGMDYKVATCIGLFRTAPHSFQCICIDLQRTGAGVYVGSYLQFH